MQPATAFGKHNSKAINAKMPKLQKSFQLLELKENVGEICNDIF